MIDLLKSSDLGVSFHLTASDNFNKSYKTNNFYKITADDIFQKISSLSSELDERDFELGMTKPLIPNNFRIQPDIIVEQNSLTKQQPKTQHPIKSSLLIGLSEKNMTGDSGDLLEKKIAEAKNLANQAHDIQTLRAIVQDFKTGLESQIFSRQTLFFLGNDSVDILWINDTVSHDDDKNNMIMSDNAGKMIANLFDILGYECFTDTDKPQIGYTALSFWAINGKDTEYEYQICLPFVKRLIYLLNPKKIILAGDMALKYLCHASDSLTNHGQNYSIIIDDKKFSCYANFNISYILRSEIIKKHFWFDLLKILHDTA